MSDETFNIEAERYELFEGPAYHFQLDRRGFFKTLGGGILVLCLLPSVGEAQESGEFRRRGRAMPREITAWLHIGENGSVTAFTGKVEIGQNIRTSLSQVVADELRVPLASVRMVMGDTELTPFDMGTFGSLTTPMMAPQLRKVAAAARQILVDLAAQRWKTGASALRAVDGKVVRGDGASLAYGVLAQDQKLVQGVVGDVAVTPPAQWTVTGKSALKVNGREIVTGAHRYPADISRPGMLYGKILRPVAFGARLAKLNDDAVRTMPDVTLVHDGEFVGVAAPSLEQAQRALDHLYAEWTTTPQPSGSGLYRYLVENLEIATPRGGERRSDHVVGSIDAGLAAADHKLEQTYTVAYIAHAPLEPRAAVAEWNKDRLTVWTGTQRPFGVHGELVQAFGMPEENVRVIMPDMGSGYGGKHTGEAAIEAARLARAAGKPVRVVWTREEEFTWAYFRPAGVIEVRSGVKNDGTLTAWEFHNYNSGPSAIQTMYDVPNQKIAFHPSRSPLRQGSYRGLAATANHFARETNMDELAHLVKMDPLEFRLKNLKDPRLKAVFEAAAEKFGWGKRKPGAGRAFGIAGGLEKGGYVAACAEIELPGRGGPIRVVRVVEAFDCGAIVSPDNLRNQIEGAIVQGMGGALFEAIQFDNGKILNPRFQQYRVPRFRDVPEIDVVMLDRKDITSAGAGETPIVGIAPAIGNAVFAATGRRLRAMPLDPAFAAVGG